MSLRLPAKSDAGAGLQAILLSLARQAQHDLEQVGEDPETHIHRLRTAMKKYRALLRLAARRVGKWEQTALGERIGLLKDGLAASRDELVIFETVEEILGPGGVHQFGLKRPKVGKQLVAPEKMVRAIIELVYLTEILDLKGMDAANLKKRFKCSLRKGRAARAAAKQSGEAQDFHLWRKRMKDIWYQAEVLRDLGKKVSGHRKPAEALSKLLGREHDLTIVLDSIGKWPPDDRKTVDQTRQRLRHEALALGRKR